MSASLASRRATVATASSAASPATRRGAVPAAKRVTPMVVAAAVGSKPMISPLVQVRNRGIDASFPH